MQKYSKLEYFPCIIAKHKGQPLSRVCVQSDCSNKTLVCYACEKESHSTHNTLSLRQFLEALDDIKYSNSFDTQFEGVVESLKSGKADCLNAILKVRRSIEQKLELLVKEVEATFQKTLELATKQYQKLKDNSIKTNLQYSTEQTYNSILGYIHEQIGQYTTFQKLNSLIATKSQQTIKTICSKTSQICKHLQKVEIMVSDNIETLNTILNLPTNIGLFVETEGQKWAGIFRWGITHPDLDINQTGSKALRSRGDEGSISVGVLADLILNNQQKIYKWTVKVELAKNQGFAAVGICLQNQAKRLKLKEVDWNSIGHGHYVIWEDKKVHSHSDAALNAKKLAFEFKNEDLLHLEYRNDEQILMIHKNKMEECWQFRIQAPPNDDYYRPCGYIYKIGDALELVQE